ncbi:MAG TPA: ankyrin repeat domain-containing protein [Tepidisphaeraceae bacterium]|jgi:cytohesin|nr:ankyrin repeat domain-containing protein [Tepidisphaeraceae bacterium]
MNTTSSNVHLIRIRFWASIFAQLAILCVCQTAISGEIQIAARNGNLQEVSRLLKDKPKLVSDTDADGGQTALHEAAAAGHVEIVRLLLAHGADVACITPLLAITPLHVAAQNGHKDVVELLLANKADVNVRDTLGDTPLHLAVDHPEVVEFLIANKADVNAKNADGVTPLHFAAYANLESVRILLKHGADAGAKDNIDRTPLHFAVDGKSIDSIKLLLANKADVNAKDRVGLTPLHCAAADGLYDVVKLLVENKADVNARDEKGETPLRFMGDKKRKTARVEHFLREHGGQE